MHWFSILGRYRTHIVFNIVYLTNGMQCLIHPLTASTRLPARPQQFSSHEMTHRQHPSLYASNNPKTQDSKLLSCLQSNQEPPWRIHFSMPDWIYCRHQFSMSACFHSSSIVYFPTILIFLRDLFYSRVSDQDISVVSTLSR